METEKSGGAISIDISSSRLLTYPDEQTCSNMIENPNISSIDIIDIVSTDDIASLRHLQK